MNTNEDIVALLNDLIDEIETEEKICSDCSIFDPYVKLDKFNVNLYLCDQCSSKRRENAQKVLRDLESLARDVEQRLQAIENTERELDQWRDQQLQKNRQFWDEYRRQVENFSSCRIGNLQYSYRMKQIRNEQMLKRLKRAKYICENLEQYPEQFHDFIQPDLIELISSEEFQSFLSTSSLSPTLDFNNHFFEQLAQLDAIIFPNEDTFSHELIDV